jgi:cob(I)alamin adenosyltransferase
MKTFFTSSGDDGYTGRLGDERVPKYHAVIEAVGDLDEASAAIGMARSSVKSKDVAALLMTAQRDLYKIMAEISATKENAAKFHFITSSQVGWLEQQINIFSSQVEIPNEFILPGDSPAGAALALARTIIRRAERRVSELTLNGDSENWELLRYLNRLSSLCFVLEIFENQLVGISTPTLAKKAG